MLSQMKKEKLLKILCALTILAECVFMSVLLTKLYVFLFPNQSWQAVLGFVVVFDLALSNFLLIFKK